MKQLAKVTSSSWSILPSAAASLLLLTTGHARAADYPTTVLADKPVAYYRLEETSGTTAADSSGNGFDATYRFNSDSTFPQFGQPGIDTNSVVFNGGADFSAVDIPYRAEFSPTNGDGSAAPFTAECWAQATSQSLSDYTSPLAASGAYTGTYPSGSGWNFYQTQGPNSAWNLFMRGGAVYTFAGPAITLLRWYYLAVTWDGTNAVFYVDGVAQQSTAIGYKAIDPSIGYDPSIGSGPQTGHGAFAGAVDEVAFYTNVLTADQLLNHYQVGTNSIRVPATPPSLVSPPVSTTNYAGTTVTFSVLANGTQPLSYQWSRTGSGSIASATDSSYSFIAQYPADDGAAFTVRVSNSIGSTNSPEATLTVLTNLDITGPPFSITRTVGSSAAFRVAATGALPITYQWSRGTLALASDTNDTLWLPNVQLADDNSTVSVLVKGPFSSTNLSATLNVQARAVSVPLTGYAKVVTADNPVAYWRLDEPAGSTVAVDAVGSFDGAYDNSKGDITFGVPTGIPGETDSAVDLSDTNTVTVGQGGVVRIPYALELNPYGPWTAEGWVNPDSNDNNGNFRTVLGSVYNPNFSATVFGWNIYQHPNGGNGAWTLNIFNGTGGSGFFGSDFGHIPLVPHTWYHLVLTDDGTTLQLYVNGVAGSANTTVAASGFRPNGINGDPNLAGGAEVLGQRTDGAFFGFSGAMDEVAFYNYALSPQQVQNHYGNSTKLNTTMSGNQITITWAVGALQAAPAVTGVYTNVPGATSPYTETINGAQKYFRVLVHP